MELKLQKLDWNTYGSDPKAFIAKLRYAFETTGFASLVNHGMDLSVVERGKNAFKNFLTKLPLAERMQYEYPEQGHQFGYTPLKIEKGEFADESDEKHFYHVYPRDAPYVKEIPSFKKDTDALWHEFHKLTVKFMRAVALSINENEDFFKSIEGQDSHSLLRGLHYPARSVIGNDKGTITEGGNAVGMCASPHTDINMITFLLAKEKGLELLYNGKWTPVMITDPNELIVNCGDMLQHLTNGIYKSVFHRVECQKDIQRFSIPFFVHVHDNFNIFPLSQFGIPKDKYPYKTAGEFLNMRLKQIGLLK